MKKTFRSKKILKTLIVFFVLSIFIFTTCIIKLNTDNDGSDLEEINYSKVYCANLNRISQSGNLHYFDDVIINYDQVSQWNNGFLVNITILNTSNNNIEGWKIEWDFSGSVGPQVTNYWNTEIIQQVNHVTAVNKEYNSIIGPNETIHLGFQGSYQDLNGGFIEQINFKFNNEKENNSSSSFSYSCGYSSSCSSHVDYHCMYYPDTIQAEDCQINSQNADIVNDNDVIYVGPLQSGDSITYETELSHYNDKMEFIFSISSLNNAKIELVYNLTDKVEIDVPAMSNSNKWQDMSIIPFFSVGSYPINRTPDKCQINTLTINILEGSINIDEIKLKSVGESSSSSSSIF